LANVGECIESNQNRLANVGECIESGQNRLANVGECIESDQFSKMTILATTQICQKWQIFGEYSNSTNLPVSSHCLIKTQSMSKRLSPNRNSKAKQNKAKAVTTWSKREY
jgi:hypothetical protein